jgi:hypothetical protein
LRGIRELPIGRRFLALTRRGLPNILACLSLAPLTNYVDNVLDVAYRIDEIDNASQQIAP